MHTQSRDKPSLTVSSVFKANLRQAEASDVLNSCSEERVRWGQGSFSSFRKWSSAQDIGPASPVLSV